MDILSWVLVDLLVLVVLAVIYVVLTSVYVLPADKMLLSLFLGDYRGVYVPSAYLTAHGGLLKKDARRGSIPGFEDIVILLWPFWNGIFFPRTNVVLRYHASQVYSEDGIPVIINITIVFELDPSLREFIEEFNVLGKGADLAQEDRIEFPYKRDLESGTMEMRQYTSPCLAQVVLDDTTDLVHEVVRKVAAQYPWAKLRSEIKNFEETVRRELAAPESRFAKAGMLCLPIHAAGPASTFGPTVREHGIDINIEDVVPVDADFLKSLSAPATGKNRGREEGNRIKAIQARTGLSGEEVMRNETVRQAAELNIIAAGDTLSAVVGGLITGRKPPQSGTSGKKPAPTPTP